ncbi:hypothetical protein [Mycolicibacterium mageritense]|uniref:Uncharacterized protein n=1 Tax=Mycolicibacterium mageritense TaxID=53462 RepID=A0AAI8U2X9_MYCME|nr:hypothetical protein [Mycolicibacterium mageritense]BDY33202.1 hypothetical protein hbim_07177 [Mycolicibacterium mageritense]
MIRRFFADGLHWIVIAYSIVGIAVYGLYFEPPAANPDIATHVTGHRQ